MDEKIINSIIEEGKKHGKVMTKAEAEEKAALLTDEDLEKIAGGYVGEVLNIH